MLEVLKLKLIDGAKMFPKKNGEKKEHASMYSAKGELVVEAPKRMPKVWMILKVFI